METKTIRLVIHPTGTDRESLTVADAMQQVLDYFKLLDMAADSHSSHENNIVWELESASTNSPFTIEAKAVSRIPGQPVEEEAFAFATLLAEGLNRVLHQGEVPDWMDVDARLLLEGLLKRNTNGIRQTDFYFPGSDKPMFIESTSAQCAIMSLKTLPPLGEKKNIDMTHIEMGSVEGRIVGLRTHYGKPAIVLQSLLEMREIPCILVDQDIRDAICGTRNWKQVYENRRVLIPGILFYDRSGKLSRVEVSGEILDIDPIPVRLNELNDPDFSEGLSPQEHLKRLWADNP
jgi:hypothetical protein